MDRISSFGVLDGDFPMSQANISGIVALRDGDVLIPYVSILLFPITPKALFPRESDSLAT
jgi:hypothetical protein